MVTITRAISRDGKAPIVDTATVSLAAAVFSLVHDELLLRGAKVAFRGFGTQLGVEAVKDGICVATTFSSIEREDIECLFDAVYFYAASTGHEFVTMFKNRLRHFASKKLFEDHRHLLQPGCVDRFAILMALGITNPKDHRAIVRIPGEDMIPILEFRLDSPSSTIEDLLRECRIDAAAE